MLRQIVTGAVIALGLAAAPAQAADEINFRIISTEASSNLKTMFEPWLAEMAKATGMKVNGFYASDYAGVIEAMRFGKVQVAWFGNKSAMEAVDRADGEIFAQTIPDSGLDGYYSHVIVHKDSPFQKLEDVLKCDKTLDFGIGEDQDQRAQGEDRRVRKAARGKVLITRSGEVTGWNSAYTVSAPPGTRGRTPGFPRT